MTPIEDLLQLLFIQLALIIAAARLGAWVFGKLGQPEVVGEIFAGLILGPSLVGRFVSDWTPLALTAETEVPLKLLSELGLVLLMFLIGLEFDFGHLRGMGRTATSVAVAGILLPFGMGAALAAWMYPQVAADVPRAGFILFLATALSITAIPILGRIMVELNIQRTRLGALTITAAAVDDVLGWILLAGVSALVRGGFQWQNVATMILANLTFVAAVFYLLRPALIRFLRGDWWVCGDRLNLMAAGGVLVLVLLSAAATSALGVFSVFGSFVLGAALSSDPHFSTAVLKEFRPLVYALLLPVFFTYTGLRTDVGLLNSPWLWGLCVVVFLVASVGKMAGCGIAARIGGLNWRESSCVAVMMNTRALMGLVAINIGQELGVVPPEVFSMLVLMALATTLLTTPVVRRIMYAKPAGQSVQELDMVLSE